MYLAVWNPNRGLSIPHLARAPALSTIDIARPSVELSVPGDRVETRSIGVFSITRDIEIAYLHGWATGREPYKVDRKDYSVTSIELRGLYCA